MTHVGTVLHLYEQFKLDATAELEKYHKMFAYDTVDDFSIIMVPTEESERQLLDWYNTNKRLNDRLEPISVNDALDRIIMSSEPEHRVDCGCQWITC